MTGGPWAGGGHDVKILEAAHPVPSNGAVDDLIALGELTLLRIDLDTVQGVTDQFLADVLARQLAHRHVRPDHLLYLARLIGVAPATPTFHLVLGDAVGPHPHRGRQATTATGMKPASIDLVRR